MSGVDHQSEIPRRPTHAREATDSRVGIFRRVAEEHAQVTALMQQVVATPDEAEREALFEEVRRELWAHGRAEQATLYAALRERASTADLADHAWEEHEEIDGLLGELEDGDPSDEAWIDLFVQMMNAVEHHVEHEEGELLAHARSVLSDREAREIEEDFSAAKEEELHSFES